MPPILYNLKELNPFLKKVKPSKILIVTSDILENKLKWAIQEISHTNVVVLPDGENAKEWVQIEKILKQFTKIGLDRKSIVIALGGGTVGDVVGFASAIYLRGVRYIQVPTTLLAQVDSAYGGKTGINFNGYKNQVGVFNNPLAIIVDIRFLNSLSNDQLTDGLGEIIKAGLIKDSSILSLLRKEGSHVFQKERILALLVKKSIAVKQFYIRKDPKEIYLRQILNVGHTVGHAIELKYKLSHGKAVLYGLLKELAVGESLGITSHTVKVNFLVILNKLNIKINNKYRTDLESLYHDKKIFHDSITMPIIEKEGKTKVVTIKLKDLRKLL
ncbi:MAG: 3-dehydroquinate synthase family protein [bacterium]|nr:3-dehydroquinate synthase family protein [bacterium]